MFIFLTPVNPILIIILVHPPGRLCYRARSIKWRFLLKENSIVVSIACSKKSIGAIGEEESGRLCSFLFLLASLRRAELSIEPGLEGVAGGDIKLT